MPGEISLAIPHCCKAMFKLYNHMKGYLWFRVILVAFSFTSVIDIVTDYLALYHFAREGHKWWTGICLGALYFSNRLGFYRWVRANYRLRDFRTFAWVTEMKLDWTVLLHSIPFLGPFVEMFCLNDGGWNNHSSNIFVALRLCIEMEIFLSCFCWFYFGLLILEIWQLIPEYWINLRDYPNTLPPAEFIVIPALELFEAVPQMSIQFRAYFTPSHDMNDQIFVLSAVFSIIGILKAVFTFLYHYPRMRLRQGVYKVDRVLNFSSRKFKEFPAVDGDLHIVRTLELGDNPGFDPFSIPPINSLKCLRLNSCKLTTLNPTVPNTVVSLANVSKVAGNTGTYPHFDICFSKRFPNLQILDLSGNIGFDADSIPSMLFLINLSLANCDLVTLGEKSWSKRFPRLESLEINSNPRLNSLMKLKSIRQADMKLLMLDTEQTLLPGFQVESTGEPEVIKYRNDISQPVPFRLKL